MKDEYMGKIKIGDTGTIKKCPHCEQPYIDVKESSMVEDNSPDISRPTPTPELKLCRCQRHKDAAFSVRRINDDFHSCPSCGGLLPVKTEKTPEVLEWEKNLPKPFESTGDNFLPSGWYYEMDDIIPFIRFLLAAKTVVDSLQGYMKPLAESSKIKLPVKLLIG